MFLVYLLLFDSMYVVLIVYVCVWNGIEWSGDCGTKVEDQLHTI